MPETPKKPTKRLILVKTGGTFADLAGERGDFEDWMLSRMEMDRRQVTVLEVFGGGAPAFPDPGSAAGVLITGSHAMVTDREAWSERTARWLAEAVKRRIPVLGVCYGHQLLAHCLGGEVADNPAGLEYGTVEITLAPEAAADRLFGGVAPPFAAHVTHTQSVVRLPAGARLLAASERDPHQAFAVGGTAWGVQFHPEFDAHVTRTYIRRMRGPLAAQGDDPDALVRGTRETPQSASLLKRFARIVLAGRDGN